MQSRDSNSVLLVGFDEAGRGPLAGPVCAAAVILPPDFPIEILNDSNSEIEKQVLITTPTTSKGVEFDYVIVPNCDNKNYCDELDKNLLYIATTRALHKLSLIYEDSLSKFVK